ncbi:MAG: InlB B-repeat-containing protein [[Clostridium] innocuum]
MKLENIVWYSIKKQDNGKPHVDGYIKAVEVEIGYYANIDGLDSSSIEHAVTGNEYTVKDYSSIRDFPNRTGYIFTGWNTKADGSGTSYAAGERFTVKNSVALYAQWKKTDQKYTIEHIDEDTNTKLKPDETFDAKYGDVINGENHKQTIEGYAFTKADSLKVGTDKEKNIIKIYYSKDANGDNVPDKYQIKVIYKAVNGTIDADHANEPENKTFYVNLYKDGKFATAEDGGAGSLKKDQIGTATAAKGYAQDSLQWTPTAPTTDLELNKDTEFVAAFEKDSFGYSIEYYYDDVKADTVKKSDKFEEVITLKPEESVSYNNKSYVLDNVENNPLTISTDEKTNVIRVYYATDENEDKIPDKYQIKVIYKAVNGTIDADHANEPENKTFYVNLYKDGKFATAEDGGAGSLKKDQIGTATAAKGYAQDSLQWTPTAPTTDLELNKDTEFVAAFEKDSFGYSIEYYYDNIKADTVKKSDKFENVISINPDKSIEYKGNTYALDKTQNNPLTISSDVEKNVIKVFYAEDKNGNGEPDYKEEKYNVNFVAEANGTLAGTTLYNSVLADTKISEIKDYVMPIPQANANYAFDKWIVKDVKHPEGIEIKDPGSYVVTGNTVFYAYFAEDNHGTDPENPDTPDNIPDKYQTEVTFRAVNGSVSFEKTYVTLYDEKGEYSENGTGRLAANQIPATTANNGYHFVNWTPDTPNEDMIISREGAAFTANHAINTYSAVVRFINEDTDEELAPSATLNDIEHGSILYGTEHRIDITGYVFTIADTEIIERNGVVVNVYYAADTKGGVDDPDTTPDGIPDKYQVRFEYTAGTNGSVSGTTIEYVTRPGNSTTASVRPQALVATAANTGYSFVSWTANGNVYSNTDALRNTYFAEDTVFTAGFAVIAAPVLPTPVTPIPPAVTPQTPGTPVPAAPAAPGTTPAATPVIVPVLPTPTPTPTPGPTVDVENPDQPQGGETTDVPDNPTPKAGSEDSWALINLLCAGGTVLLGLILLLSKLKKEEDEEDDKTSAMANKDDEQSERYKRRKWLRLASTITAIVSVIAFFLTEDITLPMILMDKWTLLMAAFLIVQIIFVLFGRKWKELDENDNSTETAHS